MMLLSLLVQFFTPLLALAEETGDVSPPGQSQSIDQPEVATKENLLSLDTEKSSATITDDQAATLKLFGSLVRNDAAKEMTFQLPAEFTLADEHKVGELKNQTEDQLGTYEVDSADLQTVKLQLNQSTLGAVEDFYLELIGRYTRGPDKKLALKDSQENEYVIPITEEANANESSSQSTSPKDSTTATSQSQKQSTSQSQKQAAQEASTQSTTSQAKSSETKQTARSQSSSSADTKTSTTQSGSATKATKNPDKLLGALARSFLGSEDKKTASDVKQAEQESAASKEAADQKKNPEKAAARTKANQSQIGPQADSNSLNEKLNSKDIKVNLTYYDDQHPLAQGGIKAGSSVPVDAGVNFDFDFDFDDINLEKGDTYVTKLPDLVKFTREFKNVPLTDSNGDEYGRFSITNDGTNNILTIVMENPNTTSAKVNFSGSLDSGKIDEPGEKDITFPDNNQLPQSKVTVKPKVSSSVSKKGQPDKTRNPSEVTWTVDFNRDYQTLTNATITEDFPKTEAPDPSKPTEKKTLLSYLNAKVFQVNYDLNGNEIKVPPPAEVPATDYTLDPTTGNLTFKKAINQPYRIVYQTKIGEDFKPKGANGKTLSIENTADFDATEIQKIPAKASVKAIYDGMIGKEQTKYDKNTQSYTWTIHYNQSQKDIDQEAKIIDRYSNNMDLIAPDEPIAKDDVTPVIYKTTIEPDGKVTRGEKLDPNYYSFRKTTEENGKKGFEITFNQEFYKDGLDQQQAYDVVYKTQINQPVQSGMKVSNEVETKNPPTAPIEKTHTPQQQMGIKRHQVFNPKTHMSHWRSTINGNNYEMLDPVIYDKSTAASEGNLGFPQMDDNQESPQGFELRDTTLPGRPLLVEGTDYEVIYKDKNNQPIDPGKAKTYASFEIRLKGDKYTSGGKIITNHSFQIEYYTYLNIDESSRNPNYRYDNDLEVKWNDPNEPGQPPFENSNKTGYKANDSQANQGLKNGSYDPKSKTITWTMYVNYNNVKTPGIEIDDPIQGNQKLKDLNSSLVIERGRIDEKGNFQKDSDVWNANHKEGYVGLEKSQSPNNQKLHIILGEMEKEGQDTYPDAIPRWNQEDVDENRMMVFKIQYETSLDNVIVDAASEYNNADVTVNRDQTDIDAQVSIAYSKEGSAKEVDYDDQTGLINWKVWLNRNQSTLIKPVVTDTPSNNQLLDPDSIKVYQTEIADDGTVSALMDQSLDPSQYKVTITTDPKTGQQTMKIDFEQLAEDGNPVGTMKKPYLITYASRPNFEKNGETVSNNAILSSNGKVIDKPPSNSQKKITVDDATGNAIGAKGSITLTKKTKTGDAGEVLPGATFRLYRHFIGEGQQPADQLMGEGATNDYGKLTFANLVRTRKTGDQPFVYLLKEIDSPFGFVKTTELANGQQIELTGETAEQEIVNVPQLYLKKMDRNGKQLGGATFEIRDVQNKNNVVQTIHSKSDSTTIDGENYADPINSYSWTKDLAGPDVSDDNDFKEYTYKIVETKAPTGYYKNPTELEFSVRVYKDGHKVFVIDGQELAKDTIHQFELANYQGSATFEKVDKDTKTGLPGARFTLYDSNDKVIRSDIESNNDGDVLIEDLAPGEYSLQETKAPASYYINNTKITFTIPEITSGTTDKPQAVAVKIDGKNYFINYKGTAKLQKLGLEANGTDYIGLKDAKFILVDQDGNPTVTGNGIGSEANPIISGENGYFNITDLFPGKTYYLKEIEAPLYDDGDPNDPNATRYVRTTDLIEIKMPDTAPLDKNGKQPPGTASIEKDGDITLDLTKERPIYNFVWAAYFTKHRVLNLKQPDQTEALGGAYYQLELEKPEDSGEWISIDDARQLAHGAEAVEVNGETKYYFKSSMDTEGIDKDGKPILGRVQVGDLPAGNYRFVETIAPEGYIRITEPIEFTVPKTAKQGEEEDLDEKNNAGAPQAINYRGAVEITKHKVDDGKNSEALEGALFNIYKVGADPAKDQPVNPDPLKSEENTGRVAYNDLAPGEYFLLEMSTQGDAYVVNQTKIPFEIKASADTSLTEKDIVKPLADKDGKDQPFINYKGQATLIKNDDENKALEGAEFKVVKLTDDLDTDEKIQNATAVDGNEKLISKETGTVKTTELSPGDYALVETKQPDGFIKNSQPIKFTIPKTVTNAKQAVTQVTKDSDGNDLTLVNYQGRAQLLKQTIDGKKLSGARFRLEKVTLDPDKNVTGVDPTFKARENLSTNAQGEVNVSGLVPGFYRFIETKAPTGYILNEEPLLPFEVQADVAGNAGIVKQDVYGNDLIAYNYQGKVTLEKHDDQGEKLTGAEFKLVESGKTTAVKGFEKLVVKDGSLEVDNIPPGTYQFIETKAPAGYILNTKASDPFTIAAKEKVQPSDDGKPVERDALGPVNVINYQGRVELTKVDAFDNKPLEGVVFKLQQAGKDVKGYEQLKTDRSGKVMIENLAPGAYELVEVTPLAGYQLAEPVTITIDDSASGKPKVTAQKVENHYKGKVKLTKTDPNRAGTKLAGAVFRLEKVTLTNAQQVEKAEQIEVSGQSSFVSDANGEVNVENLDPGYYRFVETKAPNGYILNEAPLEVFEIKKENKAAVVEKDLQGKPLVADNYQGTVELTKQDSKTKKGLANAVFELRQGDQVIKRDLTTDDAGKLTVDQLAPGDYVFVETKAPTGYVLDQTPVKFTITTRATGKPILVKLAKDNSLTPSTPPTDDTPPPGGNVPPGGYTPPGLNWPPGVNWPHYNWPNIPSYNWPEYGIPSYSLPNYNWPSSSRIPGVSVTPTGNSYPSYRSKTPLASDSPARALLQTGMKTSTTWVILGLVIVAGVGSVWYVRKRKQT